MNVYLTLLLLSAVALLQSSFAPQLTLRGVRPDLMLLAVVSWSLLRGAREGVRWAFIGGLVLDIVAGNPFGLFTIGLVLASLLPGLSEIIVFRGSVLVPGIMIVLGTLAYSLVFLLAFLPLGYGISWDGSLARLIGLSLLVNLSALPLVYFPLQWLHRATGEKAIDWLS